VLEHGQPVELAHRFVGETIRESDGDRRARLVHRPDDRLADLHCRHA
jgi:hypothetical protein